MGVGVPWVWSAAGQVDPLTGLAPMGHLGAALEAALADGPGLPLVVVSARLHGSAHPVELARRVTLAGGMARSVFGTGRAAVGSLGAGRVGVLLPDQADLTVRADLLGRMVADLPATVRVVRLEGSPEVARWTLAQLSG